jgi:hypothetical protein
MSILGDIFSGQTLSGIGTGALAGGMVGGLPGAIIGGLGGGALGAYSAHQTDEATSNQANNLAGTMQQLQALNAQQTAQYTQGIQKALDYFGPATQAWNNAYGGTGTTKPAAFAPVSSSWAPGGK